jgi:hypothetical protein
LKNGSSDPRVKRYQEALFLKREANNSRLHNLQAISLPLKRKQLPKGGEIPSCAWLADLALSTFLQAIPPMLE